MSSPLFSLPNDLQKSISITHQVETHSYGPVTIGIKSPLNYEKLVIRTDFPERGFFLVNVYTPIRDSYDERIIGLPVWIENLWRYGCWNERRGELWLYPDPKITWRKIEENLDKFLLYAGRRDDFTKSWEPVSNDVRTFFLSTKEINFINKLAYENPDIELRKTGMERILSHIESFDAILTPPLHHLMLPVYEAIFFFQVNQTRLLFDKSRKKTDADREHLRNLLSFLRNHFPGLKYIIQHRKNHHVLIYDGFLFLIAFYNQGKNFKQANYIGNVWISLADKRRRSSVTDTLMYEQIRIARQGDTAQVTLLDTTPKLQPGDAGAAT